jgi:hypothetical protein
MYTFEYTDTRQTDKQTRTVSKYSIKQTNTTDQMTLNKIDNYDKYNV